MIGYLKGVPLSLRPEMVLLDVGGVGYALAIPLSTYYALERSGPGVVGLFVHTHLRENELALYGFWSEAEKALFELLLSVSGVGPRLARVILSGMPPEEVVAALRAGDGNRLTRIPGVGRKTAERLVLELREKAAELTVAAPAKAPSSTGADVTSALVNLGYKPAAVEKVVEEVLREHGPELEFNRLLKASLQRLSRL